MVFKQSSMLEPSNVLQIFASQMRDIPRTELCVPATVRGHVVIIVIFFLLFRFTLVWYAALVGASSSQYAGRVRGLFFFSKTMPTIPARRDDDVDGGGGEVAQVKIIII